MQEKYNILKFPYEDSKPRLERYYLNDELFEGNHFAAFNQKVGSEHYNRDYAALKYIAANFAGMISKVCADMLFSEPIKVKTDDGDQDWLEALIFQNKLHTQNYESALANSRHGDAVYKLRVGRLNPGDKKETVIIEDITPSIYFPTLDMGNMRAEPAEKELAWTMYIGDKKYLRKEIHTPGLIMNKMYLMEKDTIKQEVSLTLLPNPVAEIIDTKISKNLIVHIPNWRDGSRYFGYDDYSDLMSLMYAINNRMTKTENILDKHSDPILALPEGVLEEDGSVRKQAFNMFEIPTGDGVGSKPEYIVWNASLESNFKHIDKLVEMLYMFSETSPDAFGMGKGQSDSGRALKLRLMRTIAKVARKRLYYDNAIKEVLHTAQLLAKAHGLGVYEEKTDDYTLKLSKDPVMPELEWQDGLPTDSLEAAQEEEIRMATGNTSVKDSIMRLDGLDEESAKAKVKEIQDENSIDLPSTVNPTIPEKPEKQPVEE